MPIGPHLARKNKHISEKIAAELKLGTIVEDCSLISINKNHKLLFFITCRNNI